MFEVIMGLAGGLGLFLYGIFLMSDSLEKAAGPKLRNILEYLTKNRFVGILVGTAFTAIIQSSSATTVMVVSFVNARLMTLMQAAGVIMGANIGTTVTSQLVAFNLTALAPVFVMFGVVTTLFSKNQKVKKIGMIFLGFGILFMGLNIMSSSLNDVKDSPQVVSALSSFTNPALALLAGLVVTAILQSSSATVSIIVLMAGQGLLQLPICLYLILGCNIGTCVSAMLASLGGKKDAKRAAMIHLLFNIFGSLITFTVLHFGINWVISVLHSISGGSIEREVANAHTLFKVFEVGVQVPFIQYVVKLTYYIIPGEDNDKDENFELKYIGEKAMLSPTTAAVNVISEIERMGHMAIDNMRTGMKALLEGNTELTDQVYETERYVNFLDREITDTLVKVNQMELPIQDAKEIGGLFHVVNDLERVGDHAENLADAALTRVQDDVYFSKKAKRELTDMFDKTMKIMEYSLDMFTNKNQEHMREVLDLENEIDKEEEELQRSHIKRLSKGKCTPEAGIIFSDVISGLERVSDHATNIAFAILEPDTEKYKIPTGEEDEEEKNLPIVNDTVLEAMKIKNESEVKTRPTLMEHKASDMKEPQTKPSDKKDKLDKKSGAGKKPEADKKSDMVKKSDAVKKTDSGKKTEAGKKSDTGKKPDTGKKADSNKKTDNVKKTESAKKPEDKSR